MDSIPEVSNLLDDDDDILKQISELEQLIESELVFRSNIGDSLEEAEVENQRLRYNLLGCKNALADRRQSFEESSAVIAEEKEYPYPTRKSSVSNASSNSTPLITKSANMYLSNMNSKFNKPIPVNGSTSPRLAPIDNNILQMLDASFTFATANSVARAGLIKLLEQRRQLSLELGQLAHEDKARIDSIIAAAKDKPFDHDLNRGTEVPFDSCMDPLKAVNVLQSVPIKDFYCSSSSNLNPTSSSPYPFVPSITVPPFVALDPELANIYSASKKPGEVSSSISSLVGVGTSLSVAASATVPPPQFIEVTNSNSAPNLGPEAAQRALDYVVNVLRSNHIAYLDTKARDEKEALVEESGADVDAIYNYGFSLARSGNQSRVYEYDEPDDENCLVLISSDKGAIGPKNPSSVPDKIEGASSPAGDSTGAQTPMLSAVSGASPIVEQIKCATLTKLIERLTRERIQDLTIRYVFLLTYRSFTTPIELLTKLTNRYYVPLPPNLTPSELELFKKNKLAPIQIKVCSVLKNWLEEHYTADFASTSMNDEASVLVTQLKALIAAMLKDSAGPWSSKSARALSASLKKKEALHKIAQKKRIANVADQGRQSWTLLEMEPADLSICPKVSIKNNITLVQFVFFECDELEIARQLTLLDFAHFRQIQPRECLGQAWSKKDKDILAPNICAMIDQFNCVTSWVQQEVLAVENLSKRTAMLKKFIKLGEYCFNLNNFNALFAIYCGLNANPIHRMKKTWEGLGQKTQNRWEEFKTLFKVDKNSHNIRHALSQAITPCIPHLGIFLADLTFIEDGNPNTLRDMVNFLKRRMIAERIRWIQQYQQISYNLRPVGVIQEYLQAKLKVVDEDTLWKLSSFVEPRSTN